MEQLAAAIGGARRRRDVRCIVIAGSDEVFAAGADIKAMAERTFQEVLEASTMPFWQRVADCRTPLIAAVSGFALGGGCELALLCDMIVASETAEFGQPEITLGIIPGGGGTQRLARVIGKQRTMELVLTGRRIDAKEARAPGVREQGGRRSAAGSDEALELAEVVARRPPLAVKLAKQAVLAADEMPLTRGPRARAPALRAGDGDRGPRRGDAGVPGEAPAGVPRAVSAARGAPRRRRRRRHDGRRHRPGRGPGGLRDLPPRSVPRSARARAGGDPRRRSRRAWSAGAGPAPTPSRRWSACTCAKTLEDLAPCELVIEAAPEDLELKRDLFARLSEVCGAGRRARHQHLLPARDRRSRARPPTRSASSACTSSTRRR